MVKKIISILILLLTNETGFGQSESEFIQQLFSSSSEITQLSTDLISLSVDAVWGASEATGVVTTVGTLTQSPSNPDYWIYSNAPTDKLKLLYNNGSEIDFVFNSIDGYTNGDAEDFKNSHNMDFNVIFGPDNNLQIVSVTWPENEIIKWQRSIQGKTLFENIIMNVNINYNGQYEAEIGSGYASYNYQDVASGSSQSNEVSIVIDEAYARHFIHNSNNSIFVSNTEIWNNSSANYFSNVYKYNNAHVFWAAVTQFPDSAYAGVYNQVIDAYQWIAEGQLLKNNQLYGSINFDSFPIEGTSGPVLICSLTSGSNVIIHALINENLTDIETENIPRYGYALMQNYPNPFNPSTTIEFSIPQTSRVKLTIYDILGTVVKTLLNENKSPGEYRVKFNGKGLASGIYLYSLETNEYTETKKLILLK